MHTPRVPWIASVCFSFMKVLVKPEFVNMIINKRKEKSYNESQQEIDVRGGHIITTAFLAGPHPLSITCRCRRARHRSGRSIRFTQNGLCWGSSRRGSDGEVESMDGDVYFMYLIFTLRQCVGNGGHPYGIVVSSKYLCDD